MNGELPSAVLVPGTAWKQLEARDKKAKAAAERQAKEAEATRKALREAKDHRQRIAGRDANVFALARARINAAAYDMGTSGCSTALRCRCVLHQAVDGMGGWVDAEITMSLCS